MQQVGLIPSGAQIWFKKIVTSSLDKIVYCSTISVYILGQRNFSVERILTGHVQPISGVSKSPYFPNLIATSSLDQTIRVWDIETGKDMRTISTAGGGFTPLCLDWNPSPSSFDIACGGKHGIIRIFNYANGDAPYRTINTRHDSDVTQIGYNPKKPDILFAGMRDGSVCFVDLHREAVYMRHRQTETAKIVDFCWDPMSTHYILCGFEKGEVCLYDSDAKGHDTLIVSRFEKIGPGVASLAWVPNEPGTFIAADSRTGILRFFNVSQQSSIQVRKVRRSGILEIYYMPNMRKLVISFRDGCVGLYDLKQDNMDFITPGSHTETIFDCCFHPSDPNIFATSSYDHSLKVWNIETMECLDTLSSEKAVMYSFDWHPEKSVIASGYSNGVVALWDVMKRSVTHRIEAHRGSVFRISWNRVDMTKFAASSKDMTVSIISENGTVLKYLKHRKVVFGVHWSPHDKDVLATGCHDGIVRIYSISTSDKPIAKLKGHKAEVFNVVFHPKFPNILISGSNDKTIRVWDIHTKECQVLVGHSNFVRALSWNPEIPNIAVSGGWDGTIRIWDARNGRCLSITNDHHADVYGMVTHEKRPFIYGSTSRDTTIRFWTLEPLVKKLIVGFVIQRDLTKCMNPVPSFTFGDSSDRFCLSGPNSVHLNNHIKSLKTDVERFEALFNFFSFPYDRKDIWPVIKSSILQIRQQKGRILHQSNIIHYLESKAKELESVKSKKASGIGVARKNERLKEAALVYLKQGNIRQYCELMIEVGEWDKALSVAPAVSLDYWREISVKYGRRLADADNLDCMPYYIATGESNKLIEFMISRNSLEDAALIAQTDSEGGYTPILSAINAKESLSDMKRMSKCVKSKELTVITEMKAKTYMRLCLPVLAAACFAAIDDNDRTVRELVNGNEVLLAYAVSICLKSRLHNDALFAEMASLCERCGHLDSSIEFLQQIRNKDIVSVIASRFTASTEQEMERLYVRAGLQSPLFYSTEAINSQSVDPTTAVKYFALGKQHEQAAMVCIKHLKDLFSQETWNWEMIRTMSLSMHCIDATKLSNENRSLLLAYASFIGGQEAIWKGYHTVAPFLLQNAKMLSKHHHTTDFSVPVSYLDYMICLAHSFFDRVEAENIIHQVLDRQSIPQSSPLFHSIQALKTRLSKLRSSSSSSSSSSSVMSQPSLRNTVIPNSSNLPLRSIDGIRTKSYITKREAHLPLFLLNEYDFPDWSTPTDKTKYYVSLSEAIMWRNVNPFCPLNNGSKLRL